MKKLLLTLVLVISVCIGVFAQQLTYQAVIRDANQQLVVNTGTTTYIAIQFNNGDLFRDTVSACDLLTVFDSLQREIASLKARIDALQVTLILSSDKSSDTVQMCGASAVTVTYTATMKGDTATLSNANVHPCSVTRALNQTDATTHKNYEWGTTSQLDSVSDHQGNVYRVVQIGNQCWLAENMQGSTSPKGNLTSGGSNTS